ncbi:MAG TPA: TetR/AcrR family transcriptional regulator [Galbitalea sp.]
MSTIAPEPGYASGRARRERIVAEATKLFGRVGFHGATVLEIAAQCGISRAGLLHHFPTKESLLRAVLEERDRAELARFRENGSAARNGLGVLRGMIDLAEYNSKVSGIIELYTVLSAEASAPDHPAHDYFVDRYRRIRTGTIWALTRAKAEGLLVDGTDVTSTAIELTSLIDGLQIQWLLAPDEVDMAGQLRKRIQQLVTVAL